MGRQDVIDQLASSFGRNDEKPNIALAEMLCENQDHSKITVLIDILQTDSKARQYDAIKVIYEIGARRPELIVPFADIFFENLAGKSNRIVWGALKALSQICKVAPKRVADRLDFILEAAEGGSIIAKDHAFEILISLRSVSGCRVNVTKELFDRLANAAINQLPKYAELMVADLAANERCQFVSVLQERLFEEMSDSKRKRLIVVKSKAENAVDPDFEK